MNSLYLVLNIYQGDAAFKNISNLQISFYESNDILGIYEMKSQINERGFICASFENENDLWTIKALAKAFSGRICIAPEV